MDDLISRQQAIGEAERWLYDGDDNRTIGEMLRDLPSVQPDTTTHDSIPVETGKKDDYGTSGDCISRHVAIEAVEKSMSENPHENEIHRGMHDHEHRHFLTILMGLPPAQSERPKGEWTKDGACQFCGFQPWYERDIHTLSFCPNCGADMRGEKDG